MQPDRFEAIFSDDLPFKKMFGQVLTIMAWSLKTSKPLH